MGILKKQKNQQVNDVYTRRLKLLNKMDKKKDGDVM